MNIYLVGYMYAGKTTIGRHLAHKLGFDFVDTDKLFEMRYHCSIPIFFEHYGEEAFRQLERQVLETTSQLSNTVIATGGGTPIFGNNMEWILSHGTTIFLHMTFDAICARMAKSHKMRPLLQNLNPDQRRQYIREQLALRDPVYQQAHIIFNAFDPDIDTLVLKISQYVAKPGTIPGLTE